MNSTPSDSVHGPRRRIHPWDADDLDAISMASWRRGEQDPLSTEHSNLISAETWPEPNGILDFHAFAQEYPEKLFPLLMTLRPEFQELFAEYWILNKDQYFIADCHGFIQTRTWQNLRIIEQALGAMILLGTDPNESALRPILVKAGLETTPYGSFARMICLYASTQSYTAVAKEFRVPAPAVRKLFRPTIATLLESKDVRAVAVGAYLRSMTHRASLTGVGPSKKYLARLRRMKQHHFVAPAPDPSTTAAQNPGGQLSDAPWMMLKLSSDPLFSQIRPLLLDHIRRFFGSKHVLEIFAPLNELGTLQFGYIFVRSTDLRLLYMLTKHLSDDLISKIPNEVRGPCELATHHSDIGKTALTIPNAEVQSMIAKSEHLWLSSSVALAKIELGDFVQIATGPASGYCGHVIKPRRSGWRVQVDFPTGRKFLVDAHPGSLVLLDIPKARRAFWGEKP